MLDPDVPDWLCLIRRSYSKSLDAPMSTHLECFLSHLAAGLARLLPNIRLLAKDIFAKTFVQSTF